MNYMRNNKHFINKNKSLNKKFDYFYKINKNHELNLLYKEKNYMIIIQLKLNKNIILSNNK